MEKVLKKKRKLNFQTKLNLKVQLFVGFIVPIVFVILVGIISYKKAEEGMVSNFEETASTSIASQMQYLDFGMVMINSDMLQMKLDSELQSLVGGTYKNDSSKVSTISRKTLSSINVKQASNSLIGSIYIIPTSDNQVMSTQQSSMQSPAGYYTEWSQTEEGQRIIGEKNIANWLGTNTSWVGMHPEMDALTGYSSDDYIISYMSAFPNKAAVIVVDISRQAVKESLTKVDTSDGSILGFITADGNEMIIKDGEETSEFAFSQQEFFRECLAREELEGTEYITYDGREYYFTFAKSDKTGAAIAYLVPISHVTKSAESIKKITVILLIIACITAALIGMFISFNISASMASMIKRLKKAAEGDLTVQLKTKGKSEFSVLSQHIMNVITNTRELIQQVDGIAMLVADATDGVEEVSREIEESSKGIKQTLAEIDTGVSQQAQDAQGCLTQMDSLSKKIEEIGHNIERTADNSETTKKIITKSIETMEALSGKTRATIEITDRVKEDIRILEKKTLVIGSFVETINEIAEETNLLSLNASIEAARAGEAGRGFAVVADSIRKLADGSRQAANEINKVVDEIISQTSGTVSTAVRAEEIVGQQADLVNHTKEDFRSISDCTEQMLTGIHQISEDIASIDTKRKETLEAVLSISAVSEETSVASSNVYNISQGQMKVVGSLKKASMELKEKMKELENALSAFKTNVEE